jgi:hypothetical protein
MDSFIGPYEHWKELRLITHACIDRLAENEPTAFVPIITDCIKDYLFGYVGNPEKRERGFGFEFTSSPATPTMYV